MTCFPQIWRFKDSRKGRAWPIGLALVLLLWLNVFLISYRISNPWPNSPYESAAICDAWRAAHGSLYHDPASGPVPLMYGPLQPFLLGKIMSLTGFNLYTGRILSLVSALFATGLIAFFLTRNGSRLYFFAGWIFLAAINLQGKNYFVETRPDMTAILCSVVALLMFYFGNSRKNRTLFMGGSLWIVIAFLFKQTMAMFAVVPLLVCLLETRSPNFRKNLLMAHLPIFAVLISIGTIKFNSSWLYHYMIGVNAGNRVQALNLLKRGFELFLYAPLFMVAAGDWLTSGKNKPLLDSPTRWIFACLAVTIPACLITAAPSGGDVNALIPAWLAMGAFCIQRSRWLLDHPGLLSSHLYPGIALGILLLLPLCARPFSAAFASHGDLHYQEIIKQVSSLKRKVVCPQDPTIPFFAKGYVGRSLYSELAHGISHGEWPVSLPGPLLEEMASADYLVQMHSAFGGNRVSDGLLQSLHFHPLAIPRLGKSCYKLWKKDPLN